MEHRVKCLGTAGIYGFLPLLLGTATGLWADSSSLRVAGAGPRPDWSEHLGLRPLKSLQDFSRVSREAVGELCTRSCRGFCVERIF